VAGLFATISDPGPFSRKVPAADGGRYKISLVRLLVLILVVDVAHSLQEICT
jgi:hypothetical protein